MLAKYVRYQLQVAAQSQSVISLCLRGEDPDGYSGALVERVTKRDVLLKNITPWGEADGWSAHRIEDIQQVYMDEDIEIRLQMLMEMNEVSQQGLLPGETGDQEDLFAQVFHWAVCGKEMISLFAQEDLFTGRITDLNDLYITLQLYGFFGEQEQTKQFAVREIRSLFIRTEEEKMYQKMETYQRQRPQNKQ